MSCYPYYVRFCKSKCPGHKNPDELCENHNPAYAYLVKFCCSGCAGHMSMSGTCASQTIMTCHYSDKNCKFMNRFVQPRCPTCNYAFCNYHMNHKHAELVRQCDKCSRPTMSSCTRCSYHGYAGVINRNGITIYDGR